jgi:hypothetical protein
MLCLKLTYCSVKLDSTIKDVPIGILTRKTDDPPNIVIDNTEFINVAAPVQAAEGETLLAGKPSTVSPHCILKENGPQPRVKRDDKSRLETLGEHGRG